MLYTFCLETGHANMVYNPRVQRMQVYLTCISLPSQNVKTSHLNEGKAITQYMYVQHSRDYLRYSGMVKQFSFTQKYVAQDVQRLIHAPEDYRSPCFSCLSAYISNISLFLSNPTSRLDQRREGEMDVGILCFRSTTAPQPHSEGNRHLWPSHCCHRPGWEAQHLESNAAGSNSEAAPLPALPDLAKPPIQNGLSHSTLSPQLEKEKGSVAICRGGSDRPHNTATCNPVDTDHCDSTGQGLGQGKWRMLGSMEESHLSQI